MLDSSHTMRGMCEQVHTTDSTPHSDKEQSTFPGDGHGMSDVEVRFFLRNDLGISSHASVKLFSVVYANFGECQKL